MLNLPTTIPLKLLERLVTGLIKLLSAIGNHQRQKSKRAIEYIDTCLEHMKVILDDDEYRKSEIEYSHSWLKGAHLDIFSAVGNLVTPKECDLIRQSLMSARIFFHVSRYGKVSEIAIRHDYQERLARYETGCHDQKDFRQNSNEKVLAAIVKDGHVVSLGERAYMLEKLKTVCVEDVARIDALRETLKTRQVFIIGA